MIGNVRTGQWTWLMVTIAMLGILLVTTTQPAQAEFFLDAYLGGSFSSDGELTSQERDENEFDLDDAFMIGGRLGYWLGFFPYLGVALDVSLFSMDLNSFRERDTFENADLTRVPLSGLAMLRFPLLTSEAVPRGHLQPYVAAGPTIFLSDLDAEGRDVSEEDVGLDVRAGLGLRLPSYWACLQSIASPMSIRPFHSPERGLALPSKPTHLPIMSSRVSHSTSSPA